ncbi:MAG: cytochrome c3 family protein, partial [candidate division WOR-3 bacterium]
TAALDTVAFPYTFVPEEGKDPVNVTVSGLGPEARCMVCHQGNASKASVDKAIADFKLSDNLDAVAQPQGDRTLGFINIHYYPAAATLYGTVVKGGYEYEGKRYDAKNDHVAGYDSCVGCHNSHTLELKVNECKTCHPTVAKPEDLRKVRMAGSAVDYDGDGNVKEGVAEEIAGLQAALYQAIQAYGKDVAKKAIVYSPAAYPYFFIDTNADGKTTDDEAVFPNAYNAWTGRLLKAAYNYQLSVKDPGAYAHGGKYIIQLLYDSIEDLNSKLAAKVDMTKMQRIDNGHFAGSEEAFRHWDEEGEVPGSCAKCHSAAGLPTFLKEAAAQRDGASGVNAATQTSNGLTCATCHNDLAKFTNYPVKAVKFPSGKVVSFGEEANANLCLLCHQGRESKVSMDTAIKASGATDDQVSERLSFRNPHYFAAGATLWGTEVLGAYEYEGQKYNGRFKHVQNLDTCIACHDAHALQVKVEACTSCHPAAKTEADLIKIRGPNTKEDFDGDGNATEGIGEEIAALEEALYKAIQSYAGTKDGTKKIVYDPFVYPYFFEDANGNGKLDEGEKGYATWTPRLLRAAYNYQWVQKDPGQFAHNGKYILQILYDTLKDLGVDVSKMTRPAVPPAQ